MRTLLLIGGTGFFGKSFVRSFLSKKLSEFNIQKLIIVSRGKKNFLKEFKNKKIQILSLDIGFAKDLPLADYIIYAATNNDTNEYKNNNLIDQIIKKNIVNFLNIIKKKKFKNTKILFTSSGAVYGVRNKKKRISENDVLMQNSDLLSKEKKIYAKAKIYCEKKITNFAKKYSRKFSIARCFAFIGQDLPLNKHFFIGNLLKNIKENKSIVLKSSQSKFIFRSYMCAFDLVLALSEVLMKSSKKCPVYNVGSEKAYSLYEICEILSKKYRLKFKYPEQNNKSEIDFYIPSVAKLYPIFKFKDNFRKNFSKTLKKLLI